MVSVENWHVDTAHELNCNERHLDTEHTAHGNVTNKSNFLGHGSVSISRLGIRMYLRAKTSDSYYSYFRVNINSDIYTAARARNLMPLGLNSNCVIGRLENLTSREDGVRLSKEPKHKQMIEHKF